MIKLIDILNEDTKDGVYVDTDQAQAQLGKTVTDPKSGIKSTLSAVNPETGGMTWDIEYEVDPERVYNELDKLVKYMMAHPELNVELSSHTDSRASTKYNNKTLSCGLHQL